MKTNQTDTIRTGMKIGALLGVIAFLIYGLVPAYHYGGMGTVILLSKLAGGPVEFTLMLRLIVIAGVLIGIVSLGSASIVLGSIAGTASGYIVSLVSPVKSAEEDKAPVTIHN